MKPPLSIFRVVPVDEEKGTFILDSPETPDHCPKLLVIVDGDFDWVKGSAFEVTWILQKLKPGVFSGSKVSG